MCDFLRPRNGQLPQVFLSTQREGVFCRIKLNYPYCNFPKSSLFSDADAEAECCSIDQGAKHRDETGQDFIYKNLFKTTT